MTGSQTLSINSENPDFIMLLFQKFPLIICLFIAGFLLSCDGNDSSAGEKKIDKVKVKEQFIKANQLVVNKENDEMDYYQKSHQMDFVKTKSGLRYYVYKASSKGDSIKDGDIVRMEYTVFLMDGTECYSSKTDGIKEFKVGMENLESGIHKGVKFLKSGDKALILIPSHLAHGLLGDYKKIPPQSPIVYDIHILSVKEDE